MTRLIVTWDNPGHDALSGERGRTEVWLFRGRTGGDTIHGEEAPGRREWDLRAESGTVRLVFEVYYAPFARSRFSHIHPHRTIQTISISQLLEITTAAPGLRVHGGADPRVHVDGHSSEAITNGEQLNGNVVHLHVDTRFLDVTAAYAPNDFGFRMVQFTGGAPHMWAVYIPNHADATAIDWLVFYRPVHRMGNRHVEDIDFYFLDRYTRNQADVRDFTTDQWGYHLHRPAGWTWWLPYCRFFHQIARAGKRVALAMPFDAAGSYGGAGGSALPGMIDSLTAALWSGTTDVQGNDRHKVLTASWSSHVRRRRLALAGFSFGGRIAISAFRSAPRTAVHDLWLFDPVGFSSGAISDISAWRAGDANRRLRLVGGDFHGSLAEGGLHQNGDDAWSALSTANATLWPAKIEFYRRSNVYRHAFLGGDPAHPTVYEMARQGSTNGVTNYLGFTYDHHADGRLEVYAHLPNEVTGPHVVGWYSVAEFSSGLGMVRGGVLGGQGRLPLETRAHVDSILSAVRREPRAQAMDRHHQVIPAIVGGGMPDGYPRRHQWPVFGGQATDDNPSSFKGYLQLCLENSSFDAA